MISPQFWAGRRVFLTGHTGFKGAWLTRWLDRLGADVHGFGLAPETTPDLCSLLNTSSRVVSRIGDVRDKQALARAVDAARPSIVIHMAAQALVRRSYREPGLTFESNVDGTLHLLEALRANTAAMRSLDAILVVTTDKVYRNANDGRPFAESDPLGGHDPYSASKAAAEILTASWAQSFFAAEGIQVATARAGNVIGGGDWSEDRLVPDLWRATRRREAPVLRHPEATRPWQWVLEPLGGYLAYIEALAGSNACRVPRALNFGPSASDTMTVGEATGLVLAGLGSACDWSRDPGAQPVEAMALTLDPTLAADALGWRVKLTARDAVAWAVDWYRGFDAGNDADRITIGQIERYEALQ